MSVSMDQHIFDQLDVLERGARHHLQRGDRDEYHNSNAGYPADNDHVTGLGYEDVDAGNQYVEMDAFASQPLRLDSFDEQLLRQSDHHDSRPLQVASSRARPPIQRSSMHDRAAYDHYEAPQLSQNVHLSRFAYDSGHLQPSSSSSLHQSSPSVPAYKASRQRLDENECSRETRRSTRLPASQVTQTTARRPNRMYELEADGRELRVSQPSEQVRYVTQQPAASLTQMPVAQGVPLVSVHQLPDSFQAIFPWPLFNAVQSKCFEAVYKTSDNFVLSAPTGSGKTAVLELAICCLIDRFASGTFKVVYQAPTKSLCAERQRDWQAKFGPLDLPCAELTGDTDNGQLRKVQHASIIITTPEKWDSMTRKWKDHQKLMQKVKLFLIDEVHILKDDRGATLEAVVSRMKSIGSDVRFVALSATIPNLHDIAAWLGKDSMHPGLPAAEERLGEEFRPVRLSKHVCGYQSSSNDFAFEKTLNAKLPDVIGKWSKHEPIMIFCFTRSSCVETAKMLANWWATMGPRERYWQPPRKEAIVVEDKDLKDTIASGVAFHHAGLSGQDRTAIEQAYLRRDIGVICCTSTLAVGVNLPCHMAIIKNTVAYQNNAAGGCKEYSDLEVMQMLGRAGRPQFGDSGVAVIMTRLQRVSYYEKMISGQEVLESCLHRNLIDHLNAEVGLGTVTSAASAKKWLSGTFLYVRLKENPEHYKIHGDAPGRTLDERLENICRNGIALLEEHELVKASPTLQCTEFGDAMARYYLQFDTMKVFLALPPKAKISEILSAIAQAAEFKDIRFRAGEKTAYRDLNKSGSIKFPIAVNIDTPPHKVSLVIQAVLGAVDLPTEDNKHRIEFASAKSIIFQHANRLIRCIIDCKLYLEDAVTSRNALMLARSLGAQVWDDSPLHMKQLDTVGIVSVRKLATSGIVSVEDLANTEASRIETLLKRNPPYGSQLQSKARAFPKLRISLKAMGEPHVKKGEHVALKVKAEIGFLNERVPEIFQRKPVYVCMLVETSDGHLVHFARISAKKLNNGQDVLFSANLTSASQTVRAYVMCDEIAGTMRHAIIKPSIPASAFPPPKAAENVDQQRDKVGQGAKGSKRRPSMNTNEVHRDGDEDFGDVDIDDADLIFAEAGGFANIDDLDDAVDVAEQSKPKPKPTQATRIAQTTEEWEPVQLSNGKWACNHPCKDKTSCKHLCCREGLDKKPKPPKAKEGKQTAQLASDLKQTQLNVTVKKQPRVPSASIEPGQETAPSRKVKESKEVRDLNRLHWSIKTSTRNVPILKKSIQARGHASITQSHSAFNQPAYTCDENDASSDYGMDALDSIDLPSPSELVPTQAVPLSNPAHDPTLALPDLMYDLDEERHFPQTRGSGGYGDLDLPPSAINSATQQPGVSQLNADDTEEGLINFASPRKSLPGGHPKDANGQNLFMSDNTGSIQAQTSPLQMSGQKRAGNYAGVGPSTNTAVKKQKTFTLLSERDPEHEPQPTNDRAMMDEAPGTHSKAAAAVAARHASSDDLRKWFEEEFGTESFNYIA